FKPVLAPGAAPSRAALGALPFARLPGTRLVFVDGHFAPALSTMPALPEGVHVGSLAAALAVKSPPVAGLIEKHLAQSRGADQNPLGALNNAFFHDGAFIHVPAGKSVPDPVQLLFLATQQEAGATIQPRNLVVVDRDARLTVLESYSGLASGATFTNVVTEFVLGDRAVVEHCRFQDESPQAFHIATLPSHLGRGVNFCSHSIV